MAGEGGAVERFAEVSKRCGEGIDGEREVGGGWGGAWLVVVECDGGGMGEGCCSGHRKY